jgi:hypothetical protein
MQITLLPGGLLGGYNMKALLIGAGLLVILITAGTGQDDLMKSLQPGRPVGLSRAYEPYAERNAPSILLPQAYELAVDALGKTNGYYCVAAQLYATGMARTSLVGGTWVLRFHTTNEVAPPLDRDMSVEVNTKDPPKVFTTMTFLMRQRR